MYPANVPFPVYKLQEWQKDSWDSADYGRDFDFSRPFFEQFAELTNEVPHFALFTYPEFDVNSDYTNCAGWSKNCYLISQAEQNEDCYYSRGINYSKNTCDCLRVHHCELCYECTDTSNSYRCLFTEECDNCSDCLFSSQLRGCRNCFGCHGLAQKEYHIFNKPVPKEEWQRFMKDMILTPAFIDQSRKQSEEMRLRVPHRALQMLQCEGSIGNHLHKSRAATFCFDSYALEDCRYCYEVSNGVKDAMDYSMWGIHSELIYECNSCGTDAQGLRFCNQSSSNLSELLYCDACFTSIDHCFGCFGLKHKSYCILNKQHTKEEYETLVPKIIEHMRKTKEWGEFYRVSLSPFGYNETVAGDFFPLTKEQAIEAGFHWRDEDAAPSVSKTLQAADLPETIAATDETILNIAILCSQSGRPYRITTPELAFYRNLGLPLPHVHPELRHKNRVAKRSPCRLWNRECAKCKKAIQTTYAPDRPEIVYCEKCYLETVY